MNARGFVLLEWLVAAALVIAIAAALFATVTPVRSVIERTNHRLELLAGARSALELIVSEIRDAGSGPHVAAGGLALSHVVAPVAVHGGSALTLITTPLNSAQGRLAVAAAPGATLVQLDTATRCATGAPACGFGPGNRALVFTASHAEIVIVERAVEGGVILKAALSRPFPVGAAICRVVVTAFERRQTGSDGRLVRISDGGAEQPLIDAVVGWNVEQDDQDPTRATRVSLRLRLQVPASELRGPAGFLFAHGGTATDARHWVPDVELRADVALRNRGRW